MKTEPDHDELLNEVLADATPQSFRAASLQRTLASVRRQRIGKRAVRAGLVAVGCAAFAGLSWNAHKSSLVGTGRDLASVSQPATHKVPGTNIREISDEELLAMFPNRPVALLGPPDHRQFVFLDEQHRAPDDEGRHRKRSDL